MPDDPRQILKDAGIECAAVEEYRSWLGDKADVRDAYYGFECANDALLAVAKIAAQYKWQRDICAVDLCVWLGLPEVPDSEDSRVGSSSAVLADLDRRWKEHVDK